MTTYRETPPGEPLFVTIGESLLALDHETGALAWRLGLSLAPRRMFRTANRLLLVGRTRVEAVDLDAQKSIAAADLPFPPNTGLLHEGRLILAGAGGLACLDLDCRVVWSATQPAMTQTWSFDFGLRCVGEDGSELWKIDTGAGATPAVLCIGDQISQPDLES